MDTYGPMDTFSKTNSPLHYYGLKTTAGSSWGKGKIQQVAHKTPFVTWIRLLHRQHRLVSCSTSVKKGNLLLKNISGTLDYSVFIFGAILVAVQKNMIHSAYCHK